MAKLIPCTIVFLIKKGSVLLALKRGGEAVDGTLLGPGGKIEPGETPLECAIRETKEELGVKITEAEHVGSVVFDHTKNEYGTVTPVEIFVSTEWHGEPRSSRELENPTWYPIDQLPVDKMSSDKRHWVPQILAGNKIRATFHYDKDKNLASYNVEIVDTLA